MPPRRGRPALTDGDARSPPSGAPRPRPARPAARLAAWLASLRPGAEDPFRAAFARDPTPRAVLDRAGRLAHANPALRRLAGPALPLRAGGDVTALLAPAAREPARAAIAAALGAAGAAAGPVPVRLALPAPGSDPCHELRCEGLRGGGALVVLHDVTDRRDLEARVAQGARLQAVGQLAGGIAHDFNNLLTVIVGGAEAARARAPDPEAAAELAQVLDSAGRGAALVRHLLAFSRQQTLQPVVLEPDAAVAALAGGLLRPLLGQGVRLELSLDAAGRRVRIDPTELDRVIVNLAVNARDAMPGGGTLRLATRHAVLLAPLALGAETVPAGRWVVLEAADTGCGIPPEVLPRLFEPFFTTRRDRGGTGLGLSTVHGVVRQSGGYVAVESAPGRGTTFRLWLPRHAGPVPAAAPAAAPVPAPADAEPPPAPVPASREEARLVLLVEDEAPVRRLAARALERAGFAVLAAEDGEAALALLPGGCAPPAALVTDVAMPGMDGLALARALRARFPGLPAILVSGYAAAALGQDLGREGLAFLAKPYAPGALAAAVAGLLAGPGLDRGEGVSAPMFLLGS